MNNLTLKAMLADAIHLLRNGIQFKDEEELRGSLHLLSKLHRQIDAEPFDAYDDELQRTLDWFKEAKPGPTNKDIAVQIGCHFEEVSEMLASLGELEQSRKLLILANNSYKKNSEEMGVILKQLNTNMKIEILDALCDQIVTAVGVGYMFGFDVLGALREVNDSNWSKFEDGKAVFDENGKIKKGANYFKPDLEKFLG